MFMLVFAHDWLSTHCSSVLLWSICEAVLSVDDWNGSLSQLHTTHSVV